METGLVRNFGRRFDSHCIRGKLVACIMHLISPRRILSLEAELIIERPFFTLGAGDTALLSLQWRIAYLSVSVLRCNCSDNKLCSWKTLSLFPSSSMRGLRSPVQCCGS